MSGPVRLRLVPLGTGGYFPAHGRQTMSFLLLGAGGALLLDAGSGVARLAEPAVAGLLAGHERLDILLTHYHLDHVVGLSYLPGVWRGRPVRLFAPAPPLVETGPEEALGRLLAPPLFAASLATFPLPVEVVPYREERLEIGPLALRLRAQRHPGGSVGVRIGDEIAYVTDTVLDPETEPFVRGVSLLLHEVWLTDEEAAGGEAERSGHSSASAVADLARRAGVGRLVPVHHHPRRTPDELTALAAAMAARSGLPVAIAVEGEPIEAGANAG